VTNRPTTTGGNDHPHRHADDNADQSGGARDLQRKPGDFEHLAIHRGDEMKGFYQPFNNEVHLERLHVCSAGIREEECRAEFFDAKGLDDVLTFL
jgi:hypothetical protein